jgi:hypothetical protein
MVHLEFFLGWGVFHRILLLFQKLFLHIYGAGPQVVSNGFKLYTVHCLLYCSFTADFTTALLQLYCLLHCGFTADFTTAGPNPHLEKRYFQDKARWGGGEEGEAGEEAGWGGGAGGGGGGEAGGVPKVGSHAWNEETDWREIYNHVVLNLLDLLVEKYKY